MSETKSNRQLRRLATLVLEAEQYGVDVDKAIDIFERLIRVETATSAAREFERQERYGDSAKAGDQALSSALEILRTVTGPELDRIFLAGILGVEDDDPRARSRELLDQRVEELRTGLDGEVASDILRISARNGLDRLLLALSSLTGGNFLTVCASSIRAINYGDTKRFGWIANPPKRAGAGGGPLEVRRHQGYTSIIAAAYYASGYEGIPVSATLDREAENNGVAVGTLEKYRTTQHLAPLCKRWRVSGEEDAAAGRPRTFPVSPLAPPAMSAIKSVKRRVKG